VKWSTTLSVWSQGLVALVLAVFAVPQMCLADEPAQLDAACMACHGPAGNRPVSPQTPRLAGQLDDYLVEALKQYRSGARPDPIMGAMAKGLSDTQIQALARYYSTQPGLTVKY
jgi:cytochrome c553